MTSTSPSDVTLYDLVKMKKRKRIGEAAWKKRKRRSKLTKLNKIESTTAVAVAAGMDESASTSIPISIPENTTEAHNINMEIQMDSIEEFLYCNETLYDSS